MIKLPDLEFPAAVEHHDRTTSMLHELKGSPFSFRILSNGVQFMPLGRSRAELEGKSGVDCVGE